MATKKKKGAKPSPAPPSDPRVPALLDGFVGPSRSAYDKACKAINEIVFDKPSISVDDNFVLLVACALAGHALPGYATLDYGHVRDIKKILGQIERYLEDSSNKRPLNLLMLASPGAGKSHFIKCMAEKLGKEKFQAVTYNMVGLQRHEDLIPPLDAARNFKVEDRLPLLFLDEFDAQEANYPLLLPLLWDGQITLGKQDLKLGKVVVVLAGSDPKLPEVMKTAKSMLAAAPHLDGQHPKIVDLLSRINGGVIEIPSLNDPKRQEERRADKVCMTLILLRKRFGKSLQEVPLALLRFVAAAEFRYGARSIAHLIDLIPYKSGLKELTMSNLRLPVSSLRRLNDSSLAYHLVNRDQAPGVVKLWGDASAKSAQILIAQGSLEAFNVGLSTDQTRDVLMQRLEFDLGVARKNAT